MNNFAAPVPETHRPYVAAEDRYTHLEYRRVGRSGLLLPPLSLGLWWNFGDNVPFDRQRTILRRAFDLGITHFDLANNYGPPYGAAEENFGRMMRTDFLPYRDELVLSSKAGYDMWPGPHGDGGSRKYLLASLDASLARMSVDHVDIFYSHRFDPATPVEETMAALDTAVRQGKARYAGISSYSAEESARAVEVAAQLGTPIVIHQPSYSILDRCVENGLLATLADKGVGSIGFLALAQGLLTDRYIGDADPQRSQQRSSWDDSAVNAESRQRLRALARVAQSRGQSLAQMSLSWVIRAGGVTSTLIGVSSVQQLKENVEAAGRTDFTAEELAEIDRITASDTTS